MYFHNSLIPRGAYFLLPLESKQEATSGWNFTKWISEVEVNQLKVRGLIKGLDEKRQEHWIETVESNDNLDSDLSSQVWKVAEQWKGNNKDVNMSTPFTTGELVEVCLSMTVGKAPVPDDIHPEFILHAGDTTNKWLCQYMSTTLERCKIPTI